MIKILSRKQYETDFEYALRLINAKANNEIDEDYVELFKQLFNVDMSSDECRKRFYGMKMLLDLYKQSSDNETKILVLSDLHIPFHIDLNFLNDFKDNVDILVFNGDEQDCQSISVYNKKYRKKFVDEMIETRNVLMQIIDMINPRKVIFNYGNHNIRLINYFSEHIHEDLLELMPETNLDFIVDIGFWKYDHEYKTKIFYRPLKDVYAEKNIEVVYTHNWWCKVGNTIFAHPKAYRSRILGTSEQAYLYFLQIGEQFDCLVVSHTHSLGYVSYGRVHLFENGCLCKQFEYMTDGKLQRPQVNGCLYLVHDSNGNVVYPKSKLVIIEREG